MCNKNKVINGHHWLSKIKDKGSWACWRDCQQQLLSGPQVSDGKFQVSPFTDGDASKNYITKEQDTLLESKISLLN